jgi:tetratricopeptide (TPR) repeat protein
MEKLVAYYPKKDYWLAVVQSAGTRSGLSERLALDFARLKLATGTMRTAAEFIEAAQLSIQAGLPAEAKKIIDQGYAAGLLGSGADADRHRRLKDMAVKNMAEDAKTLGQDDAQLASGKDGNALLNAGLNYVLLGSGEKGLDLMEQGLRKGGLKYPDDARLHLGYAYHVAGQNQKAIQTFKKIQGTEGPASLARLWVLHLSRGS